MKYKPIYYMWSYEVKAQILNMIDMGRKYAEMAIKIHFLRKKWIIYLRIGGSTGIEPHGASVPITNFIGISGL